MLWVVTEQHFQINMGAGHSVLRRNLPSTTPQTFIDPSAIHKIDELNDCNDTKSNISISPRAYFDLVQQQLTISSSYNLDLYGRIDRVLPTYSSSSSSHALYLTTRPNKKVNFEQPLSFVMGQNLIRKIPTSSSLRNLLETVISLEESAIEDRLKLTKEKQITHNLIVFKSENIQVEKATISGILKLLGSINARTAELFKRVQPQLENLVGEGAHAFNRRISLFEDYWDLWFRESNCQWFGIHQNYPECGCQHLSLDEYCTAMDASPGLGLEDGAADALVTTRKMMYILIGCNKYFGMDGFTYDSQGGRIGEEYLARNTRLDMKDAHNNPLVEILDLSQVQRFLS